MMYTKVLALLSLAAVGSARSVCQDEVHIKSSADLDTISGCYSSLIMSNTNIVNAELPRLTEVTGELTIFNNTYLNSIALPNLKSVGTFNVTSHVILQTIDVAQLTSANIIYFRENQRLQNLDFTTGLEKLDSLNVNNNGISTLKGIEKINELEDFIITANIQLKEVQPSNLTSLSGKLTITNNHQDFKFSAPKLISIDDDVSINNVTTLQLDSLTNVKEVLDFSFNYFDELVLSNLTQIGEGLSIISNSKLSNVSFPALKSIGGGLLLANNSVLSDIDGFNKLSTIGGALDVTGPITNLTFPKLESINGAAHIESSQNLDCNHVKETLGEITKSVKFTCKDQVAEPTTSKPSGSDHETEHKNSASVVSAGYALIMVVAACLFM